MSVSTKITQNIAPMTQIQREMAIEFLQDPMLTTDQKTRLLEGVFYALPAGVVNEVVTSHQSGRINLAQALAKLGGGSPTQTQTPAP